jgi:hypothetical protein
MSVYLLDSDMHASSLQRLRVASEDKELQTLLARNPYLLPSEQIDPDNPPQWLLVKREMPVTDPATGSERWSLDFLFVDHMGVPTLVECKRCDDTRARREVIAQMLEYAANGHHYWSAAELQSAAHQTAGGADQLNDWINRTCEAAGTATEFFEIVERNLRESRMRLIFFLEDSPNELRSLVDFLNRQLNSTEVFLVEARLYQSTAGRVVVPWLFGYTEEARVAKRGSREQTARLAGEVGEAAFRSAIEKGSLAPGVKSAIGSLLEAWPSGVSDSPGWVFRVNAIFVAPALIKTRGLFHVGRNGDLQLYFGYWKPETATDVGPEQVRVKTAFAEGVSQLFGIKFTEKQLLSWPSVKAAQWTGKVSEFV